ncbi:hypothetical protein TNIN_93211 [Trichonephila inaurata madagascariensis]|uniref:Uncharacterized protein n=1 Tax=Trichonephila inaurata madagascariensis TaxID=2747483 RepID=A0A8X6X5M4_9ARAC|nr:hypothetical protein TNIN_93211 [Trichonephila inaurata madagascariensis]
MAFPNGFPYAINNHPPSQLLPFNIRHEIFTYPLKSSPLKVTCQVNRVMRLPSNSICTPSSLKLTLEIFPTTNMTSDLIVTSSVARKSGMSCHKWLAGIVEGAFGQ